MYSATIAQNCTIPPEAYQQFVQEGASPASIQAFAQEIGIAPGIVVGRLQHDGHLASTECNHLKRRLIWTQEGEVIVFDDD